MPASDWPIDSLTLFSGPRIARRGPPLAREEGVLLELDAGGDRRDAPHQRQGGRAVQTGSHRRRAAQAAELAQQCHQRLD